MKTFIRSLAVAALFLLVGTSVSQATVDTTLASQWGIVPSRHGSGWHLTVNAAGDTANAHGTSLSGWEAIRGAFYSPITGNTGANGAVVVSGKITFVGEGPDKWSALRYGLYYQIPDSVGPLQYTGTDSVRWSGPSAEKYSNGYSFMPQSGTTYAGNIPSGFNGTQGICVNGSWISSYSGPGFGGMIQQAPARASMSAGTYDFAFSVQPLSNGTKRINFYLIKEGTPIPYWYGGSLIDTTSIAPTFNGVCFGVESATNMTNMIVTNVHDTLGPEIVVPKAPWQAFYVDQWGKFVREGGWHFAVDPDTIIGNAGVAGTAVPTGNWVTIRGGFTIPVTATAESAIVVTGDIEFVGSGPVTWSGLRYGLFRTDTAGTVQYALTDSARWGSVQYKGTDSAKFTPGKENSYGYMLTPQSGTTYAGNIPSFANGGASQGVTKGGSWISTYGGAQGFGGLIPQQPARAQFSAGKYKWAISVQPQTDGSNEVRFYMVRDSSVVTYWYGGTLKDTSHTTVTFNGVCFGLDPNYNETTSPIRAMILTNVKVDLGAPINVPTPPWQYFYVSDWGMYGGRLGGWHITPDIIGNTSISGDTTVPSGQWAAVRGGFPITVSSRGGDSAIVVTGELELDSRGFEAANSLRYGLFYSSNPGNLDSNKVNGYQWSGTEYNNFGYLFIPPSGSNNSLIWGATGQSGTFGGVVNRPWISTGGDSSYALGNNSQRPAAAIGDSGLYKFQMQVVPQSSGQQLRFTLVKWDSSYMWGGVTTDMSSLAPTKYNAVMFAIGGGSGATALKLTDVKVDLKPAVSVPTVLTGVVSTPGILPKAYALSQNYPNPFNPTTTFRYDIPKISHVKIVIYDVLGRVVTTLVDGVQAASSYTLNWNAQRYSSGVYFCRIEARAQDGSRNFTDLKKLLLMK
jgi:Secretion system C-terminal sorting domain